MTAQPTRQTVRTGGPHEVDVLVVGGGPAGMTIAGDLARAGRTVAVLERWPHLNPSSRAFATMARTLEVLDARGLADQLLELGHTTDTVGLFADARIDLTHLRSRYPFALVTPQTNVDQALGRYAAAQGAAIHRGTEVVALDQDASGVTVTARPKDDDDPAHRIVWRARYVVAADGAHSTVRGLIGVNFPGKSVLSSVVLADVKLSDGPEGDGLRLGNTVDTFGFLVPYSRTDAEGSWFRSMTWDRAHQAPDTAPVDDREISDVLRRSMGRDVGVLKISWRSRFHCDERQVANYRHGRVFLVGDAAHVHSPMGGQGMNTGIQDAANLAWKLDAALGGAPDAVLDTYQDECHPIGKRVLVQSGLMLRGITVHPRPARWLRDHIAGPLLRLPRLRDLVAGSFAGTELRYPHGRHEDALVGTRATEVPLAEGRLTEIQRTASWVLVRRPGAAAPVELPIVAVTRTDDGPDLLVRPDGYVAWAGDAGAGSDGWRAVLAGWSPTRLGATPVSA